jgi:hypothetical protein
MRSIAALLLALPLAAQSSQPCVAGRAVDRTYLELSESTGGQLFLFQQGEMKQAAAVMQAPNSHPVTLMRAVGQLSGEHTFEFPVDSTVRSMLVMASVQCRESVAVIDPSGSPLAAEKATRNVDLQSGRILQIDTPRRGPWKVRLSGNGLFIFSVLVQSKIAVHISDEDDRLRIRTEGFQGSVTAYEVDASGRRSDGASRYRIAVEGVDELGFKVLRTNPVLFAAKKRLQLQATSRTTVAW